MKTQTTTKDTSSAMAALARQIYRGLLNPNITNGRPYSRTDARDAALRVMMLHGAGPHGYLRTAGRHFVAPAPTVPRLGDRSAPHLFEVFVGRTTADYVKVDARSHKQAESIARRAGYSVYSSNMVG